MRFFKFLSIGFCLYLCACASGPKPLFDGDGDHSIAPKRATSKPYKIRGEWYYPQSHYEYDKVGYASWYGPNFHGKKTATGEVFNQNDLTAAHRTLPLPCVVRVTNLENGKSLTIRVNDRGPFIDPDKRLIDLSYGVAQKLGVLAKGVAKVHITSLVDESYRASKQYDAWRKGDKSTVVKSMPVKTINVERIAPRSLKGGAKDSPAQNFKQQLLVHEMKLHEKVNSSKKPKKLKDKKTANKNTKGVFLQLGSFKNAENAKKLVAKVKKIGPTTIAQGGLGNQKIYQVRIGPLQSSSVADKLQKILKKDYRITASRLKV